MHPGSRVPYLPTRSAVGLRNPPKTRPHPTPEPRPPAPPSADHGPGSWGSAGALLALAAAYLVDLVVTSGEIERGASIAGVDVGGLTPDEATAALNAQVLPLYAPPVTVDVHGEPINLDPASAGLTPDVVGSVAAAGERSANPNTRLTSFFRSSDLPLAVGIDQATLTASLSAIAQQTAVAPVEGAVTIEGTTVRSVAPVIGRDLLVPEAVTAVSEAWRAGGRGLLEGLVLPVFGSPVRASAATVDAATAEATAILSAPLVLDAAGTPVEVPVPAIAAATAIAPDAADGFTITVDSAALRASVAAAVQATEAVPADATIAIVNDAPVINPAVSGRSGDWAATDAAIQASVRSPARTVPVSYAVTQPSLTTEQAQVLGIKEVIGEFTTGGFATVSGVNIRVVAEKVNGAIVQPRATFGSTSSPGPGARSRATSRRRSSRRARCPPPSAAGSVSSPPRCTTPRISPVWATSPTPRTRSTSAATRPAGRRPCSIARSSWRSPTTTTPGC
jgi:hypothetical protein